MRHTRILAIATAVAALVASVGVVSANEPRAKTAAADSSRKAKVYYRKRPLEVTIYGRRRVGGYSYRRADAISTYGKSPPPYLDVRQSPGGPFDSGFFFDSGIGPRGGNSLHFH